MAQKTAYERQDSALSSSIVGSVGSASDQLASSIEDEATHHGSLFLREFFVVCPSKWCKIAKKGLSRAKLGLLMKFSIVFQKGLVLVVSYVVTTRLRVELDLVARLYYVVTVRARL